MTDEVGYRGTGRRKTACAQVRVFPGKGIIEVNGRSVEEYFPVERRRKAVLKPLDVTGTRNDYDVKVKVKGGGETGQAEAIVLGISRALARIDREFHDTLKEKGLLSRDSRMVERKKYGRHKARRRKQFSKR